MALIELDLTAQPDPPPTSPPPAHRYRLGGLLLAAVLAFAAGGAVPALPVLWRQLGEVPASGGPEAMFQLAGGRVYTVAATGAERVVTGWTLTERPRRVWTVRLPAPMVGGEEIDFGGVEAEQAGDVVLLSSGTHTTAVDAGSGAVRWTSRLPVTVLPGGRVGVVQEQQFRDGTWYDQASGDPGMLYFSSTGEPHTEPPLRTEVRGIDLATGARRWTVAAAGAVNVLPVPGAEPAVLLLASDRLERIDAVSGAVRRRIPLPEVGGSGPTSGELVDDAMLVYYGAYGSAGHQVAYSPETLARRWSRSMPRELPDPPRCTGVLCVGSRTAVEVLDPATGQPKWRVALGVDLTRRGGYLLELGHESGLPARMLDAATGAPRVDLAGWYTEVESEAGQPLLLRRPLEAGASAFGVVLERRDAVQLLGVTHGVVGSCAADPRYVVCRADDRLRIWAYRT